MKFSIQIKFIATLFLILISINHLNGSPVLSKTERRPLLIAKRETATAPPDIGAALAEEEVTNQSATGIDALTSTTLAPKEAPPTTPTVPKSHNKSKFQKPEPYEPPEKTWKALQICGIITFFVVVLYYLKKITKKFERNQEADL